MRLASARSLANLQTAPVCEKTLILRGSRRFFGFILIEEIFVFPLPSTLESNSVRPDDKQADPRACPITLSQGSQKFDVRPLRQSSFVTKTISRGAGLAP